MTTITSDSTGFDLTSEDTGEVLTDEIVQVGRIIIAEMLIYETLAGLAEGRVYPATIPDNAAMPAITFQRISTVPVNCLEGTLSLDNGRFQIDCWGLSLKQAIDTFTTVRQEMLSAEIINTLDNFSHDYEPETKRYRVSADFMCWHDPYYP